jgi:O-Antigen ligase
MKVSQFDGPHGRSLKATERIYAAVAVGLSLPVLALVIFLPQWISSADLQGWILFGTAVGIVAAGTAAVFYPRLVFYGFLFLCLTAPFALEEIYVPMGFFKLYAQDVVFLFNIVLITARLSLGKAGLWNQDFNRYILLHVAVGGAALFNGYVVQDNAFDYSFGDFRRAFFYFLNYFTALFLTDGLVDARRLLFVFQCGGVTLIAKGILQILFGRFYYRRIGDVAHILSHFELTFLSFMVLYALIRIVYTQERRWWWALVFVGGILVTLVGNYRAAWLSMIGGSMFVFLFLSHRKKVLLLVLSSMFAAFLVLAVSVMWDVEIEGRTTIGEEISAKANIRETTSDPNVIWRFQSYENAFGLWKTSPVFGVGLGEELEFSATTSTGGAMIARSHRVHNSLLWMLMSVGAAGLIVFLYVQYQYIVRVIRYIRIATWEEGRTVVMACGAFYTSFMISTMFEIFLESAMPVTVLSVTMALAVLMMGLTPAADKKLSAS